MIVAGPSTKRLSAAIDVNCRHVTRAGTTRYVNGLISGFAAEPDFRLHEISWPVDNLDYKQPVRAVKTVYRERIWAPFVGTRLLKNLDVDVFHSPAGYLIPPPPGLGYVTTLHDLGIVRHPERYRLWQRKTGLSRLRKICEAKHIITVSRFTADEAMKIVGVPAGRLFPIHHGCDFTSDSHETCPSGFETPNEFLLFVGSLEPGKNLTLMRGLYEFAARSKVPLPPLVIVGARWEGLPHEGPWPSNWIGAGRISDEELVYLYRRALALVFPSKYEGFGLPLIEAMTLGCPVICSPVSSLPEVAGDAALFSEMTVESYLKSIRELMANSLLRDEYVARGYSNAKRFSWRYCAQETLEVYQKTLV